MKLGRNSFIDENFCFHFIWHTYDFLFFVVVVVVAVVCSFVFFFLFCSSMYHAKIVSTTIARTRREKKKKTHTHSENSNGKHLFNCANYFCVWNEFLPKHRPPNTMRLCRLLFLLWISEFTEFIRSNLIITTIETYPVSTAHRHTYASSTYTLTRARRHLNLISKCIDRVHTAPQAHSQCSIDEHTINYRKSLGNSARFVFFFFVFFMKFLNVFEGTQHFVLLFSIWMKQNRAHTVRKIQR